MSKKFKVPEEDMTVTITLDDDEEIECQVVTIISVDDKDYIALLPKFDDVKIEDAEVWLYGYKENPDDPNEEPELIYIDDDDEYDMVADAFDEYLDEIMFDDLNDEDE